MSDKNKARRTEAEVYIAGVDISASLRPRLISLTYTDNEEDKTDDLQIKLQDRDGVVMNEWLNSAVQSASSSSAAATSIGQTQYQVTAKSGLNVRSGPGTDYSKLGAYTYGTIVTVMSISNGWAKVKYSGKDAYLSAAYLEPTDSDAATIKTDGKNKGLSVQAIIVRQNWHTDGKDDVLDCGEFELDSITASGPPSEVTLKCTSLPYRSQVRQTKKSKAWEGYKLSKIGAEIASKNGMSLMFESAYDPEYERLEQVEESDIAFLSRLCHDAGVSLKATSNIIVMFDQAKYEKRDAVKTIVKGDGSYTKWNLATGNADTSYASCRVKYTNPATGKAIIGIAYTDDYDAKKKDNQQLEIVAKVSSVGEAETLAAKHLRLKNKFENSATFTLLGNPQIVAGVTITLEGWGLWNGKYIVKQAKHSLSQNSGYTTQISLRRVLEGY